LTCGECLKDAPDFTYARAFGLHDGALKKAINLFKFHGINRLSKPLSEKIFHMQLPQADMILPVPLYKTRLRERGFNQSALLSKYVANHLKVPLNLYSLIRNRDTRPQVGLSAKERKKNIKDAFEVHEEEKIKGRRVMLIDDVFTTGATVRECSRVLRNSGAHEVFVITLSHGVLD
jgi:ComF family protein